ncbi:O-antigen ligase family protein [Pseudomonas sp. TCU-HL1]|uniref:O-antigen ligase family protein n=1 Tax=Pseudomonas sp. TCU-HL1 TaxID=1856685 RepID=UPI00083D87AC|nr:O-antigen ligase family protein [Pseudomonas sp. TCU-HL1]AOE87806.1 hypothetical protein THL1_5259 [Pseudomonas sp. TCU-HL1]
MYSSPLETRTTPHSLTHLVLHRWLVLGYLALLTGMFWIPSGSLYTKVFYGFIAAPALLGLVTAPRRFMALIREPVMLSFLALTVWLLLSLAWTRADEGASSLAKRPLYVFMLFAGCSFIALSNRDTLLKTLRIGAGLAAIAALVNLYLFFTVPPEEGRLIGTGALRNPLLTSHILGAFCAYWLAAWIVRDLRQDWLPLLLVLILTAALIATGSRTPLMALGLTSVWMLAMNPRRATYAVAIGVVAAILCLLFYPDILLQRGASYRPQIWSDALHQAREHLWLGHGFNSSFTFTAEGLLDFTLSDPHNIELAVLLELGLVGLAIWLLMFGLGLLRCLNQRRDKGFQIASAMVVYGLGAGLTEGSSFLSRPNESWFLIWIPLSLVVALSVSQRCQESR